MAGAGRVVAREAQEAELGALLGGGGGGEALPGCVLLCGAGCTGKSLTLLAVLRRLRLRHACASCLETYAPRLLYETLLAGLRGDAHQHQHPPCDTLPAFLHRLNALETDETQYEPIVIVLDKAERLRSMDHAILSVFLSLRRFTHLNVCTVLITDLVYENFHIKTSTREPIIIYFPNYTKEELLKIIFQSRESFVSYVLGHYETDAATKEALDEPELFSNFLNAFLSVFYRPCRDLIELKHMVRTNFAKYCEPIIKREIKSDDLPRLWRHISPILKSNLELLYLRLHSSTKTPISPGKENDDPDIEFAPRANTIMQKDVEKTLTEELTSTKTFAQSFELPYYAKYLLIAAYLASYNPAKEDKRLFMKYHGKQRKRMQQVRAKAKISEKLNTQLGPKVFTLDRLLAIFYAILEEKIGLTSNLLSQIATLVELKLLSSGKEVDLDSAKYKCVVGYDFIAAIAQTVGFNVRKYLYDFI